MSHNAKINLSKLSREELAAYETKFYADVRNRKVAERKERLGKFLENSAKTDLSMMREEELNKWERQFLRNLH